MGGVSPCEDADQAVLKDEDDTNTFSLVRSRAFP